MNNRIRILAPWVGTSLFGFLCAQSQYLNYTWANYLQQTKQLTKAQEFYTSVVTADASPYVYRGYIPFLADTNQWKEIVGLVHQYDSFFKNDLEIQSIFAQAFENMGNQRMYDERLAQLHETFKSNMELAISATQMYVRRKEPENALIVIDNYLNNSPEKANNFIFHFMKAQIYVQLSKRGPALDAVKKSIELYPKFDKSWLMLAILEEQSGKMDLAARAYTKFLEETNESKETIRDHLDQLIQQYNINPQAYAPQNSYAEQVAQLKQEQKFQQALTLVDACLSKEPYNRTYRLAKIDLLIATKQLAKAAELLVSWLNDNPDDEHYHQALNGLQEHGMTAQQLIHHYKQLERKHPSSALIVDNLAQLYRESGHAFAERYLKKAYSLAQDPEHKIAVGYELAQLQFETKRFDDAKQTLLQIYASDRTFAPAINLLAYYYASKENNLPHAYMLIEQAVMQEPTNTSLLDTKAYILYKQGNYDQAYALLQNCITQESGCLPYKHMAKVLYKLGKRTDAQTYLEKAIALSNPEEKKQLSSLLQRWTHESNK